MGRPTKTVEQPAFLVHLGHIETWTDYGNGFGSDREVPEVKPNKMGARLCRWLREGDCVCIDLRHVSCPLCLKSKPAREKLPESRVILRNTADAESRLFWKKLDESCARYEKETTPQQRFQLYCSTERGRRIAVVASVVDRGTKRERAVLV